MTQETKTHGHYVRDVSHLDCIDVYRVLALYEVTCPATQHAIKKLLCAGKRGTKTREQDLEEARKAIVRAIIMMQEDRSE